MFNKKSNFQCLNYFEFHYNAIVIFYASLIFYENSYIINRKIFLDFNLLYNSFMVIHLTYTTCNFRQLSVKLMQNECFFFFFKTVAKKENLFVV